MPSAAALLHLVAASRARQREQWLSREELGRRRVHRLRQLATVARRSPYWAGVFDQIGLRPDQLDDGPMFERLPVLERETLQTQADAMRTVPAEGLFLMHSSGTTGRRLDVYRNEREQADVSAVHARIHRAYGRRLRDRQLSIGSGFAAAPKGPIAMLRRSGLLPPILRLSSFDPVAARIEAMRRFRPDIVSGYAVAIEELAEAMVEGGVRDVRPHLVYTGSMRASERCRRLAQEAFGVRPLDIYATMETGPLAWECPESPGDYHLNDDVQLLEIVGPDGRRLPDGETGEVVVTPLTGLSHPLFRYRLGDLAARRTGPCQCGRGLALMGQVEGRTAQTIKSPTGRQLNVAIASSCFSPQPDIRRWQMQQVAPDRLRVLLMVAPEWNEQRRQAVTEIVRSKTGGEFAVELLEVDEIPLAPNGKFLMIVPLASAR
jgi:phenylacetate-CoA ligase